MLRIVAEQSTKTFVIDETEMKYVGKALSLPVGDSGRYPVRYRETFPLSQLDIEPAGDRVYVTIPTWLLDKKGLRKGLDGIIQY